MNESRVGIVEGPAKLFVRPPRAVWWLSAAWVCVLFAFSVLSPLFQAPDEPQHVDRILDASAHAGFEDPTEGAIRPDVYALVERWHAGYFPPRFSVERAPGHPRPSLSDLGAATPEDGRNQQTQHPPAYYSLMATMRTAVTSVLPEDVWTADREVMLLRIFNVLLVAAVPYLCWATAKQLGWPDRLSVIAALFPLAVPQLGFVGGSVNNDNLVVLAASLTFLSCARILHVRMDRGAAALLAGGTALALMAKGNAIALVPFVVFVAVVAWRRGGQQRRLAVAAVSVAALGGLFYVRNLIVFGEPFPSNFVHVATRSKPIDLLAFAQAILTKTSETFWGKFGWLAVPTPQFWTFTMMALLVMAVVFAVVRGRLPYLRIMLMPVGFALVLYLANAFQGYEASGTFPAQQGRYLFICMVPISLAVAAAAPDRGVLTRRIISVLVVANHALATVVLFDFYWPGGLIGGLESIAAWSPLGWSASVLLVGCWVVVIGSLIAIELGSEPDPAPAALSDPQVENGSPTPALQE